MSAECIVCAYEFDGVERLRSLTICGHNDLCSLCFLRIRTLQKNMNCPTCKRSLEYIVCSASNGAKFDDFERWEDSIGPEFVLDQKSQIFFPAAYYKSKVQKLWTLNCSACKFVGRDMRALRAHVSNSHGLHICQHCVDNKQVFPAEQKIYTQKEYEVHLRHGDQDGSLGHPNCEFCRKRYYDSTALFIHLTKDHYSCHICEKNDIKFKYYKDYDHLEDHFRHAHVLCEDPDCLAKKFVVFDNPIDLEVHNRKCHPYLSLKRTTNIKVEFKSARPAAAQRTEAAVGSNDTNTGIEEDQLFNTTLDRYEGGLGGRALDGEWQVELQPTIIARDPRDANRYAHINLSSAASRSSIQEDFPSLQEANLSSASAPSGQIQIANRWISMGSAKMSGKKLTSGTGKQSQDDFPSLQSSNPSSASNSTSMKGTSSSNNSTLIAMQRDYNSFSGTEADNNKKISPAEPSLSDWARVKTTNKGNQGSSVSGSDLYNSKASTDDMQPFMPGQVGTNMDSTRSSLSVGESQAIQKPKGWGGASKPATLSNKWNSKKGEDFPALQASTDAQLTSKTASKGSSKKTSGKGTGGWEDALLAVGMSSGSSKKQASKISVVRLKPSASINKTETSKEPATDMFGKLKLVEKKADEETYQQMKKG